MVIAARGASRRVGAESSTGARRGIDDTKGERRSTNESGDRRGGGAAVTTVVVGLW
jgi:hypothetical protein